jgi:hypothetical protein
MRICANIANDDANKNKFKTLRQRRLPAGRQGSSFGGKAQNYNLKVKSNVIASSPEASGDKAISLNELEIMNYAKIFLQLKVL